MLKLFWLDEGKFIAISIPDTLSVLTHTKPRYFDTRIKNISKVFDTAVERPGLAHATPHCLRHTSITEAVYAGANVVSIGRASGKTLKILEEYAHSSDERLHQAVAGIGNIGTKWAQQKTSSIKQERK